MTATLNFTLKKWLQKDSLKSLPSKQINVQSWEGVNSIF